jgi:4-alpha-glucanotransferase
VGGHPGAGHHGPDGGAGLTSGDSNRASRREPRQLRDLRRLANLHDVQPSYEDVFRRRRSASADALLGILRALGVPIERPEDATGLSRGRALEIWRRPLEPVTVAWDGAVGGVPVRLAGRWVSKPVEVLVTEESAREGLRAGAGRAVGTLSEPVERVELEGQPFVVRELSLAGRLPPGSYQLRLEAGDWSASTLVLSAPRRCFSGLDRTWGMFLPLYAARSRSDWGAGDLGDLEDLVGWVGERGGGVVATLPLLAGFLDELFEPSPYSPASRLFWNELYLDVERVPELGRCPEAQALLASQAVRDEVRRLRARRFVDYRRVSALKRRVLEALARCFFAGGTHGETSRDRTAAFRAFTAAHPLVRDYARFRAHVERTGSWWGAWPRRQREGRLTRTDVDPEAERYHAYVQWLMAEQLKALGDRSRDAGVALHLDLPLGVNPGGYDAWRFRDSFAQARGGAPPDSVFDRGQDWGFAPLHPQRIREEGYRYPRACLQNLCRAAGIMRIDHVMGLHRLYCIPDGLEAVDGVYLRYRAEEFYALLSLESHRTGTLVVGEDLGTVPRYVRHAMARHDLHRTYVVELELLESDGREAVRPPPLHSLASLNTHDMEPFAAFWAGLDIEERRAQGLIDDRAAGEELQRLAAYRRKLIAFFRRGGYLKGRGRPDAGTVMTAVLAWLAASDSRVVLANLEDLWLETERQNRPGTQAPTNWSRKARYSLERIERMPEVVDILRNLARNRVGVSQGGTP